MAETHRHFKNPAATAGESGTERETEQHAVGRKQGGGSLK